MDSFPTSPVTIAGLQQLIDLETLATYLVVPVATVYGRWARRLGPPAYRIGQRLMFAVPQRAGVDGAAARSQRAVTRW